MLSFVPFLLMSLPTISLAQTNCNLTDTATKDSTATGFTINWAARPEECSDTWVRLCVKEETEGTFVDRCLVIKDVGTTLYSATGLTECSSYRYVLEVANTDQVMQTIEGQQSTRPNGTEMIRSAKISLVSNTTFLLTWEPRYNNSPCASIYRVCWGTNVTSASSCRDMNHTATSCYIRGLTGDTLYTFQIKAVFGDHSESDAYTLTANTHSGTSTSWVLKTSLKVGCKGT
uniref:Fibronectin type-III domain-containing protein n=1 Tax=Timema poppense TaxID=170557 RepID=A0A7R9D5M9_TIMPO|nr:unnamed protein product [Timema poppensis]